MKNQTPEYAPLEYNERRLQSFFSRAIYRMNLPKAYRPPSNVDRAAFADAMIGFYLEDCDDVRTEGSGDRAEAALARVAFTLQFLQGVSPVELTEEFNALEDREDNTKLPMEYALGVAGIGARYVRDTMPVLEEIGEPIEVYKEGNYEHFQELGDFVRRLYEDNRVSRGEASALMLLFRQAESSATLAAQKSAITTIEEHLRERLKRTIARQPHRGDELIDQTFVRGANFIKVVLKNSSTMLVDERIFNALAKIELMRDDSFNPATAYQSVLGHIGYTLNKVY